MITPKQLFRLMREHGVADCEIVEGDKTLRVKRHLPPETFPVVYSPQRDEEGLDNSAAMPEYNGDPPYKVDGVYDDPELYPDGVEPVAEMRRASNGIRSD